MNKGVLKMTVKTFSKSKDANKKLSTHFIVGEFACHDGSDKILHDDKICPMLEKIFSKWDVNYIAVNSGYRTPEHDVAVGGTGSGQHTMGTAADFQVMIKNGEWLHSKYICCFLQDNNVPGIGYISSKAVHLDYRTTGKWWGDETNGKNVSDWYTYFDVPKTTTTSYYPKCSNSQSSYVDGLKEIKVDSSMAYREKIASKNGLASYSGTASENEKCLNLLKNGKLIKV